MLSMLGFVLDAEDLPTALNLVLNKPLASLYEKKFPFDLKEVSSSHFDLFCGEIFLFHFSIVTFLLSDQ